MQTTKLKQILLQKTLAVDYFYFGAAKSGRAGNIAYPLGPKSGLGAARHAQ